jgi:hypothetical protein
VLWRPDLTNFLEVFSTIKSDLTAHTFNVSSLVRIQNLVTVRIRSADSVIYVLDVLTKALSFSLDVHKLPSFHNKLWNKIDLSQIHTPLCENKSGTRWSIKVELKAGPEQQAVAGPSWVDGLWPEVSKLNLVLSFDTIRSMKSDQ